MTGGGIHRFGIVSPFSSCIAHQFYLVESRRSYISCAGCISSFSTFKSIEVPFELPILLTDDNIYPAISENSIALWNARFLPSVIDVPSHTFSTCTSRPPRRLSPRFSRRFSRRLLSSSRMLPVPTSYRPCRLLETFIAPLPRCHPRSLRFPPADRTCPCMSPSIAASSYRFVRPRRLPAVHTASSSGYCGGSSVSSHGSARGGEGEPDMPVRRGSARLLIAFVRYDRCRIVYPFPQVIGAADTRY